MQVSAIGLLRFLCVFCFFAEIQRSGSNLVFD